MKRSEMVEIIKQAIFDSDSSHPGSDRDWDKTAIFILDKIQLAGMAAPLDAKYKEYYAKELGYNDWEDYIDRCGFSEDEPRGGWEPENE